jgi:hypothetical protein
VSTELLERAVIQVPTVFEAHLEKRAAAAQLWQTNHLLGRLEVQTCECCAFADTVGGTPAVAYVQVSEFSAVADVLGEHIVHCKEQLRVVNEPSR